MHTPDEHTGIHLQRLSRPSHRRKLSCGEFDLTRSLKSLASNFWRAVRASTADQSGDFATMQRSPRPVTARWLPERMADGLSCFNGCRLPMLSGSDLTAKECIGVSDASKHWCGLVALSCLPRLILAGAAHTSLRDELRLQVAAWTAAWVRSW